MTQEQVSRYIDLVRRRTKLLVKGSWDVVEMEAINRELAELRPLVDKLLEETDRGGKICTT